MISNTKIKEVVKRIVDNFSPEKIILFGSYANGCSNEDSDLDIFIIKDFKLPRYKRNREVKKFLRGIKIPMDILVYTPDEVEEWKDVKNSFVYEVLNKGEVLYG